ncbi:MAG: AbrB/MazE/SpoVT family DNA-binding domain-containing protein [Alphaproteobacteria bacterium]|nr:AbrB/MazE/SpoVT family DNA-binding domain-containing protein [Alphaproteobacteria bacterium]
MTTARTRTFKSGNSQAIRLPKDLAYPDGTELVVERAGDVVTIYPLPRLSIKEMLAQLDKLPKPTSVEIRDEGEIEERSGL